MVTKHYFLLFYLLFFSLSTLNAQEKAKNKQSLADGGSYDGVYLHMSESYELGDMQAVIDTFQVRCLRADGKKEKRSFRDLKKELRMEFYGLVAQAYLALNEPKKADPVLRKFFAIRYYDEELSTYWPEMRQLRQTKYEVTPSLLIGVTLGVHHNRVVPLSEFHIFENVQGIPYEKSYYNFADVLSANNYPANALGLSVTWLFSRHVGLRANFSTRTAMLGYQYDYLWTSEPQNLPETDDLAYSYYHFNRYNFLDLEFAIPVQHRIKQWTIFAEANAVAGYLLSAEKDLRIEERITVRENGVTNPLPSTSQFVTKDIRPLAYQWRTQVGGGFGVGRYYKRFYFQLRGNYMVNLNEIMKGNMRYNLEQQDLPLGYNDLQDRFYLDRLGIELGINFALDYRTFKK
jgi:hypothetical protein